ncbi:MAG: OpgC domain-containing protein, partial [Pseudomonadota bacterium]
YWAHIGMFAIIAMSMVWLNSFEGLERDYINQLNLHPFFNEPERNLFGLMTLTYVPNYFDILPMYLVILAMMPLVMALARIHPAVALGALVALWMATSVGRFADEGWDGLAPLAETLSFLHLPAQYWFDPPGNERSWFFNPFAWQLVFFTGFAFMRGWIPAPPVNRWLILAALAIVVVFFFASHISLRRYDWQDAVFWSDWRSAVIGWRVENREFITKTDFGILRYVHFLAVAYLAWVAVGPRGARLQIGVWWPRIVGVVRKVGQQSLAVFLTSMVLARFMGVGFDLVGKSVAMVAVINLAGFGVLIAVAYFVGWIKSSPWKTPPQKTPPHKTPRPETPARPVPGGDLPPLRGAPA